MLLLHGINGLLFVAPRGICFVELYIQLEIGLRCLYRTSKARYPYASMAESSKSIVVRMTTRAGHDRLRWDQIRTEANFSCWLGLHPSKPYRRIWFELYDPT